MGASEDLAGPAGFVSAGAFVDIRHPRHDLRRHLLAAWRAEGRAVPDGRARWLSRYAAFPLLLRAAPYPE